MENKPKWAVQRCAEDFCAYLGEEIWSNIDSGVSWYWVPSLPGYRFIGNNSGLEPGPIDQVWLPRAVRLKAKIEEIKLERGRVK